MKPLTLLGKRIKERLKEMGKNQIWLADQLDISPSHLTSVMTGQRGTTIDGLTDMAKKLKLERDEVIRLYRNETTKVKSTLRDFINLNLDFIEETDADKLSVVAQVIESIANTTQGKQSGTSKEKPNKA